LPKHLFWRPSWVKFELGDADTESHCLSLKEWCLPDGSSEKRRLDIGMSGIGVREYHQELFAAETTEDVLRPVAEMFGHERRYAGEYLISDFVTVPIVDLLEEVNVDQ
jgi:hypothetical protein